MVSDFFVLVNKILKVINTLSLKLRTVFFYK